VPAGELVGSSIRLHEVEVACREHVAESIVTVALVQPIGGQRAAARSGSRVVGLVDRAGRGAHLHLRSPDVNWVGGDELAVAGAAQAHVKKRHPVHGSAWGKIETLPGGGYRSSKGADN